MVWCNACCDGVECDQIRGPIFAELLVVKMRSPPYRVGLPLHLALQLFVCELTEVLQALILMRNHIIFVVLDRSWLSGCVEVEGHGHRAVGLDLFSALFLMVTRQLLLHHSFQLSPQILILLGKFIYHFVEGHHLLLIPLLKICLYLIQLLLMRFVEYKNLLLQRLNLDSVLCYVLIHRLLL